MTANNPAPNVIADQRGYVLVIALLMLVILTAFGIFSLNTSLLEIQISGNDKVQKQTFSDADGGTQVGSMLLEENIACPTGFSAAPLAIGGAMVYTQNFWINGTEPAAAFPSDTQRHISLPNNDAAPHTNLFFSADSSLSTGYAIQMLAGYEGPGFAASQSGGQLVTNIYSQRLGEDNSVAALQAIWRHLIGQQGTCLY